MNEQWIKVSVRWFKRPLTVEDTTRRTLTMLAALRSIDDRFDGWVTTGRSSRSLPLAEAELSSLLLRSFESPENGPSMPREWSLGVWNGRKDNGQSVGLSVHVLGDGPPDPLDLGSFVELRTGAEALQDQHIEGIMGAVISAWDPDEGAVMRRADGVVRTSTYRRDKGWHVT